MTKEIYSLGLAKCLCSLGHKIVDLRYDNKYNKHIFVFEVDDSFNVDLDKVNKDFKQKRKY